MNKINFIPFGIKARIGRKLTEAFYLKMGKRLEAEIHIYHGNIDIEWAYIGNRKRDTLLFLHGFADRKENFYFASQILSKDYDIIIPDMPGFGQSTIDSRLEYNLENYENWLSEFIEGIKIEKFHLAGNSLGGAVCTKLAAKYPDKIKSLSLINAAGFYITESKSIYDEVLNGLNLFQVGTPEDYEIFRDRVFHKKPDLPAFVREYMIKSAMDNHDWYGKIFDELLDMNLVKNKEKTMEDISLNSICNDIKMPTMIFWGKHDTLFPYKTAEFIKGEIPGSRTHIFKDLGHCPHHEGYRDFANELADFIKTVE